MRRTPFPTHPSKVVALTAAEFACGLHPYETVSIDAICHRFLDDANRAVVWLIRFRALSAWCERAEMAPWLSAEPDRVRQACAVAASFELNSDWEFDAERFRSAVQARR